MEPITELPVQQLDGGAYELFKRYLERHKVVWSEERGPIGQLESVHLTFPPGTTYHFLKPTENYERRQVDLPSGAMLYWTTHRLTKLNGISVPMMHVLNGGGIL